jgi:hypothetical protein
MSFGLRVPFELPAAYKINIVPLNVELVGLSVRVLEFLGRYMLAVEGFASESEASAFLPQARKVLSWVAVKMGVAIVSDGELQPVVRWGDPHEVAENLENGGWGKNVGPVHGIVNYGPFVFEIGEHIRVAHVPPLTVGRHLAADEFIGHLKDGFCLQPGTSDRLETALDLYHAHVFETSQRARLLTLAMVLEVLKPKKEKAAHALALLDGWDAELKSAIKAVDDDAGLNDDAREKTKAEYGDLEQVLSFRREVSIRKLAAGSL